MSEHFDIKIVRKSGKTYYEFESKNGFDFKQKSGQIFKDKLNKLDIKILTNDLPLDMTIELNLHKTNFVGFQINLFRYFVLNKKDTAIIYFPLFNEPLIYVGKELIKYKLYDEILARDTIYKIMDLDLKKNVVHVSKSKYKGRVIGYKKGNYVDISMLNRLKSFAGHGDYYFLNYFGYWCAPCRAHMQELINLEVSLPSYIKPINIRCKIPSHQANDSLYLSTIVHNYNNIIEEEIISKNIDGFIKYFNVWQYPKWVLVDKEGRIIFDNASDVNEVRKLLEGY